MKRVGSAPEKVTNTTYEHATNKLLRDADKLEQKVCNLSLLDIEGVVLTRYNLRREEHSSLQNTLLP